MRCIRSDLMSRSRAGLPKRYDPLLMSFEDKVSGDPRVQKLLKDIEEGAMDKDVPANVEDL